MSAVHDAKQVAVVGSPSTNYEVTLDLLAEATHDPLVGSMLLLTQPSGDGLELGLGMVTEVTTVNQWHTNPALRGVVKTRGAIPGMSGDTGDVRMATIKLQAAYRNDTPDGDGKWRQSGPTMRMSPPTGSAIRKVTDDVLAELTAGEEGIHYLGHLHGSKDVRVPMQIRDFSGDRGAWHAGFFGISGGGKALDVETRIPTPSGWTRMGDLKDGDIVFDENGQPTRVVQAHPIMNDRPCFKVTFSDGSEIVADADHNWYVETDASRRSASNARRRQRRGVAPTLLPVETVQSLTALILNLPTGATATLSEIARLVGVSEKSYLIAVLLPSKVAPVGREQRERDFAFAECTVTRTREYPLYDTRGVLTGLLSLVEQGKTRIEADAVERMRSEIAEPTHTRIPLLEIARLMGRVGTEGRAGGAISRAVQRTGVKPEPGPWSMEHHISERVVTRAAGSANVYPLAEALAVLIEEGSRPVHDQSHKRNTGGVLTTAQIAATLKSDRGALNYSVPVTRPLHTQPTDLPLDPYFLGVWLGDGKSDSSRYYSADPEIAVYLEGRGFTVNTTGTPLEYTVTWPDPHARETWGHRVCPVCSASFEPNKFQQKTCGRSCGGRLAKSEQGRTGCVVCATPLGKTAVSAYCGCCRASSTPNGVLRGLGVLNNKHIPAEYLRASEEQRRDLLAGLLDTDGTVSSHGPVQFDNTTRALIDGVFELAASLGYRPTITEKRATLNGKDCGPGWRVSFTTGDDVFRLERKRLAHKEAICAHNPAKVSQRYIVAVEPVESRPVRCISVDSPNNLYLAGESMIPTHNTAMACYTLGGQLRHRNHGLIIIDPQGQWSHENGLPFSLQGFAAELGREVTVRRISEDLRLEQDAPLFGELLGKTRFVREIMKMATETQEILVEELVKVLKGIDGWPDMRSEALLDQVLRGLRKPNVLRRIYSDNTKKIRLMVALSEILGEDCEETIDGDPIEDITLPEFRDYRLDTAENRRKDAVAQFAPLHNLFSATNPGGGTRHSLWGTVSRVFDKEGRGASPAPMLVLDMSTSGGVSWLDNLLADDNTAEAMEALKIIDQDGIKAAILRQVCRTLKRASEAAYREGDTLNTNVVLDEAWRYVPPPHLASDEEIKALSTDMAGYFRDTRKFGIGWCLISQSPRSINSDCWDQMTVRVLGYGLAGPDIERIAEQVDDRDHLKLYRAFAPPDSTNPKVYPFMLVGPVSPLSFSKAPILLAAYTNFQEFRDDNREWIEQIRLSMGQPVLSGAPAKPGAAGAAGGVQVRPMRSGSQPPRGARATEQIERVRAHRTTGGVDPAAGRGLGSDPSFSAGLDALDLIDADEPPF